MALHNDTAHPTDSIRSLLPNHVPMNSLTSQSASNSERLKISEYIGYALGDTASNIFFKTFTIFLPIYYTDVLGIPPDALLWIMPVVGLIGAFTDPTMGLIADRTKSRWGKFRPYLLWGAIPYGICGYLMFAGPNLGNTGKILYAFITYALMLTAYSVINVPYSSLLGVVSSSSRTRAVASSYRFAGAFAGGLLVSLFVHPFVKFLGGGNETQGYHWTMAIFAVVSVIMFWITFATTKERVTPPPQQKTNVRGELGELVRNWPWVVLLIASVLSTTFIALQAGSTAYYFKYVFKYATGDDTTPVFRGLDHFTVFISTGMLAQVIGTMALGFLARKVDKKYAAAGLCATTGLCFMAFYLIPKNQFVPLLVVNALAYLAMGPTSALTWALYGDVADYGESKFGRRSTGLVFSASLFAIKTGNLVGQFLLPLFLVCFEFVKPAKINGIMQYPHQSESALRGITLAFSLVPGFIALLKAIALMIYPLNQKRVDEVERELAARRAAVPTK